MGRHVFLTVLGFSLLALVLGMLVSTQFGERPNVGFPWQVETLPDGSTRVFQVQLGTTTLGEMEQLFQEASEITLFDPPDEEPVIEAYFDALFIGGLKSKMVVSFDLPDDQVQAMYDAGVRISTLGSGTRKVTLNPDDLARVRNTPVHAITYLPSINLEPAAVEKRFGTPDERITDAATGAEHWLYPDRGVDVVMSAEEKEVVQYVLPENFAELTRPLHPAE